MAFLIVRNRTCKQKDILMQCENFRLDFSYQMTNHLCTLFSHLSISCNLNPTKYTMGLFLWMLIMYDCYQLRECNKSQTERASLSLAIRWLCVLVKKLLLVLKNLIMVVVRVACYRKNKRTHPKDQPSRRESSFTLYTSHQLAIQPMWDKVP